MPALRSYKTFSGQFFLKMGHPRPLFVYFHLFKETLQFLQQINVKNVHPIYSDGIQTHDLWTWVSSHVTTRPGLPSYAKCHLVVLSFQFSTNENGDTWLGARTSELSGLGDFSILISSFCTKLMRNSWHKHLAPK